MTKKDELELENVQLLQLEEIERLKILLFEEKKKNIDLEVDLKRMSAAMQIDKLQREVQSFVSSKIEEKTKLKNEKVMYEKYLEEKYGIKVKEYSLNIETGVLNPLKTQ
jgi:hypothetical protein